MQLRNVSQIDLPSPPLTSGSFPSNQPLPVFQLMLQCLNYCHQGMASPVSLKDLSDPCNAVLFEWIGRMRDEEMRTEFPFVPHGREQHLRNFAHSTYAHLQTVAPVPGLSSAAQDGTTGPARPTATHPPFRSPLDATRWAFNGRNCAALSVDGDISVHYFLEQISSELDGQGVHDEVLKGQCMRNVLTDPLCSQLINKIRQLPDLDHAIRTGAATLSHHYAEALVSCAGWSGDAVAYQEATHPTRRHAEPLQVATARAEHNWRAADVLGFGPLPAGRFWALFGMLTTAERAVFSGRPGVNERMLRPFRESADAANRRFADLLADLLHWARLQTSADRPLPPPPRSRPTPPPGIAASSGSQGPNRPGRARSAAPTRRGTSPHPTAGGRPQAIAAAAAPIAAPQLAVPGASASDSDDEVLPRLALAAVARAQPFRVYNYTGDRGADEEETRRRLREGLCLHCWVQAGQGVHGHPHPRDSCPHHHLRAGAPGCRPYPAS